MKVIATREGYYREQLVKAGEVFTLADAKDFSPRWMEKFEGEPDSTEHARHRSKIHRKHHR